jgi:hypothetical protein
MWDNITKEKTKKCPGEITEFQKQVRRKMRHREMV